MKIKIKAFLIWTLKAGCAFVIAFFLLNILARFYYYIPWNVESDSEATDFAFPANFSGFNGVEGIAPIELDENGYNNAEVPDTIDILCMGSSHTFAYCVPPGEGYPAVLEKKLMETDLSVRYVYNIGVFAHRWVNCTGNLEAALEEFSPSDYVIVESELAEFELAELQGLCNGKIGRAQDITGKTQSMIKRFPYLQLAGRQLKSMLIQQQDTTDVHDSDITNSLKEETVSQEYMEALDQVCAEIQKVTEKYGCKYILLFQPPVYVDDMGNAYTETDSNYLQVLKNTCSRYGLYFVDMTERFLSEYNDNQILPRGFVNTAMGDGHLNRDGHALIADELYRIILEIEGAQS